MSADDNKAFVEKIKTLSFTGYRESQAKTLSNQRHNEKNLRLFERAVKEGSLPRNSYMGEEALREADRLGRPFRADNMGDTINPELNAEIKKVSSEMMESIRPDEVKKALDNA